MLRTLVDRPPVGGREFLPLSEQSLMGFRLHPGPVSGQGYIYCLHNYVLSLTTPILINDNVN